ncbi:MAG: hypothetical protein ACRDN0_24950 [Trebonia sp.]
MNSAGWVFTSLIMAAAFVLTCRYFFQARMRAPKLALAESKEYRALADEYRRLSDMAITSSEHVDLRLTDLSVRLDELRDQLDQMQRILKEVE